MLMKRLTLLAGIATVAAVTHHASQWVLTAMFWWADRYRATTIPDFSLVGKAPFVGVRLVELATVAGVPAFLFISGNFAAFAMRSTPGGQPWKAVLARIRYLLPPYLLWSTVMLTIRWLDGQPLGGWDVIRLLLTGGAAAPYYYVPLLIQLYAISPFLVAWITRRWQLVLGAAVSLSFMIAVLRTIFLVSPGLLPEESPWLGGLLNAPLAAYSVWFVIGIIAGTHSAGFKRLLSIGPRFGLALTAVLGGMAIVEWEIVRRLSGRQWFSAGITLFDNLFLIALLLLFLSLAKSPDALQRPLGQVGSHAYGIYLSHVPILEVIARGLYHFAPRMLGQPLLLYFVLVLGGIGLPLGVMGLLRASPFRRVYAYAFG
jgi:surface polysaccharide O-acyltransferase-like enzyme